MTVSDSQPASSLASWWGILRPTVVPATAEVALVRAFQVLDALWMGRAGTGALGMLAVGLALRWAVSNLAAGLSAGGLVLVSQCTGRGDRRGASTIAWQTLLLCLALAAIVSAAGYVWAGPLLGALHIDPRSSHDALPYLRISFLGLVPMVLALSLNALLWGSGQGRAAVGILGLALAVAGAIEPILVLGFGPVPRWGAPGSALALLVGLSAGAVLQIVWLSRRDAPLRLRPQRLGRWWPALQQIIALSAPTSIPLALRALAQVVVVGIVARFGSRPLASYAVASVVLMALLVPSHGLGNLASALGVCSLGQGNGLRAHRGVWAIALSNTCYLLGVVGALSTAIAPQIVAVFSRDPRVIAYSGDALRIVSLGYVSSSMGVVLARGLDATGHSVPAATINLLALWGIQVPVTLFLTHILGLPGVWLGWAIGSVANGLLLSYRFRRGRWYLSPCPHTVGAGNLAIGGVGGRRSRPPTPPRGGLPFPAAGGEGVGGWDTRSESQGGLHAVATEGPCVTHKLPDGGGR